MRIHHLALGLLPLALLACDPYSEAKDSGAGGTDGGTDGDGGSGVYEDCDPKVYVPVGTTGGDEDVEADAHEETFGADAPDPYHVRYQWPARDPSRSGSFLWRTDTDTLASQIKWGPADGFPDNATTTDGYTFLFGGGSEIGDGAFRMHEVRLCGQLEPDTTYSYQVGGEGHWSNTYSFTTPGAPGSFDSFRVAISGDSRGAYATWGDLMTAMDSHEPDFFLFSGDMVELGANQNEWDSWFEASGDILAQKAFVAAHGNHEFLAQNYFAQFGFPGNEEWFAVEYGDMLVLSLNDTVRSETEIASDQKTFIEQELAATERGWRVGMHHQPAYSTCTNHSSNLDVRDAWSQAFEDGGAQLVTAGHNHIYERSVPIYRGEEASGSQSGTTYMVSGGAGAPLYENSTDEWFGAVANPIVHYVIADFDGDTAEFVVRDLDGNVIDQFTLSR